MRDAGLTGIDGARVEGWELRAEIDGGSPPWRFRLLARKGDHAATILAGRVDPGARWRRPWIEARVEPGDEPDRAAVFERLGRALPAGAYVMLDLAGDVATRRALALGVPPACTREGWLLWRMGARWFKVWDFPEGGREGGEKLQGNLPLDRRHGTRGERAERAQAEAFLRSPGRDRFPGCVGRARALLAASLTA